MQKHLALLSLMGLAGLAGGCASVTALPVASVLGSPNSATLEMHDSSLISSPIQRNGSKTMCLS
jgi:hypothetical protein